jgi:DNA-binding transcriptional LysR family regulator
MEWSDFRVLLALARAGSVAGAARELRVDNSTISRRLAALEEALGAKLLIRGGREFAWTCEGRAVIEAAESMEAAATNAQRAVRASKLEVEGSVRVSVAPAFAQPLLRLLVPDLHERYPQLHVELSGAYQRADLAKGDADIALRMVRPEEPDLVARRAFECGWAAYASTSYLALRGHPASFEALSEHALVLYSSHMHNAPPMRWMEEYKGSARVVSRMDSLETACQAASVGGGVAVLPAFVGDPIPELRRVFTDCVASNTGWIVYHDSLRETARVRVVADALLAFFAAHAPTFSGCAEVATGHV